MSIFSRFADIINSNINALLDKAEDPDKLIRMIIQEMEDTLVEVRTVSARALADRKEYQRKASWLESEIMDWQQKAELAISKQRDDLAKAALLEKSKLEADFVEFNKQIAILDDSVQKLSVEIIQLQDKLSDARSRQKTIKMRLSTQGSRLKVKQKIHDSGSYNVVDKFERFERKLDELEAQAESYDLGRARQLKEEFENLESSGKVDQELDDLKNKINKQK